MTIAVSSSRAIDLAALGFSNNPFVAWNNLGASATLGGSTPSTGGERANAVTGTTYDKWRAVEASGFAWLDFDFGTATNISFAAIAAHNIGTLGASVRVMRSSDGVTYTDAGAGSVTPSDNSPIAWRMATSGNSARYWRITVFDLSASDEVSIGVAFLGNDLTIERRFYQGFAPVITPTEVQAQSNVSVGNEFLGDSIIGRGSSLSAQFQYVDPKFVRGASWKSFQTAFNEMSPFFFAWRPEKYPDDIHYCKRTGATIRPENSGPRDLMGFAFNAMVHNGSA